MALVALCEVGCEACLAHSVAEGSNQAVVFADLAARYQYLVYLAATLAFPLFALGDFAQNLVAEPQFP